MNWFSGFWKAMPPVLPSRLPRLELQKAGKAGAKRRFAGTIGAEDSEDLAGTNIKCDVPQDGWAEERRAIGGHQPGHNFIPSRRDLFRPHAWRRSL